MQATGIFIGNIHAPVMDNRLVSGVIQGLCERQGIVYRFHLRVSGLLLDWCVWTECGFEWQGNMSPNGVILQAAPPCHDSHTKCDLMNSSMATWGSCFLQVLWRTVLWFCCTVLTIENFWNSSFVQILCRLLLVIFMQLCNCEEINSFDQDSVPKELYFWWRMASSGMLRRVGLVRADVSEELSASFIRVTRICELETTIAVTSNRRTLWRNTKWYQYQYQIFLDRVRRLLVTASVVPSSPTLVSLMEALSSYETSVFTIATRHNIPKDAILHIHRCENLKSYKCISVLVLRLKRHMQLLCLAACRIVFPGIMGTYMAIKHSYLGHRASARWILFHPSTCIHTYVHTYIHTWIYIFDLTVTR
jgi:hypothetical protein